MALQSGIQGMIRQKIKQPLTLDKKLPTAVRVVRALDLENAFGSLEWKTQSKYRIDCLHSNPTSYVINNRNLV